MKQQAVVAGWWLCHRVATRRNECSVCLIARTLQLNTVACRTEPQSCFMLTPTQLLMNELIYGLVFYHYKIAFFSVFLCSYIHAIAAFVHGWESLLGNLCI